MEASDVQVRREPRANMHASTQGPTALESSLGHCAAGGHRAPSEPFLQCLFMPRARSCPVFSRCLRFFDAAFAAVIFEQLLSYVLLMAVRFGYR